MVEITSDEVTICIEVNESSAVGEARRQGTRLGQRLGLDETTNGKVALVITELGSNLVKHAQGGKLFLRGLSSGQQAGIEILALDQGPGMPPLDTALRDGYSRSGTAGNGLGAVRRLSDRFDLYSNAGHGSALVSEIWSGGLPPDTRTAYQIGSVSATYPGEIVCGDGWAVRLNEFSCMVMLADGLGHGLGAAEAAREAITAFQAHPDATPIELLQRMHDGLRKTRGAAVAVAEIDAMDQTLRYAAIGNITGVILSNAPRRSLVTYNGIVGHQAHKFNELSYPWRDEPLLMMHSDGLGTHWSLDQYPGLLQHHPSLIAGVLYRDYERGRDDATVLVIKSQKPGF